MHAPYWTDGQRAVFVFDNEPTALATSTSSTGTELDAGARAPPNRRAPQLPALALERRPEVLEHASRDRPFVNASCISSVRGFSAPAAMNLRDSDIVAEAHDRSESQAATCGVHADAATPDLISACFSMRNRGHNIVDAAGEMLLQLRRHARTYKLLTSLRCRRARRRRRRPRPSQATSLRRR